MSAVTSHSQRRPVGVSTRSMVAKVRRVVISWSFELDRLLLEGGQRRLGRGQLLAHRRGVLEGGLAGGALLVELALHQAVLVAQAGDGRVLGLQLGQLARDGPAAAGRALGRLAGRGQLVLQLAVLGLELGHLVQDGLGLGHALLAGHLADRLPAELVAQLDHAIDLARADGPQQVLGLGDDLGGVLDVERDGPRRDGPSGCGPCAAPRWSSARSRPAGGQKAGPHQRFMTSSWKWGSDSDTSTSGRLPSLVAAIRIQSWSG